MSVEGMIQSSKIQIIIWKEEIFLSFKTLISPVVLAVVKIMINTSIVSCT